MRHALALLALLVAAASSAACRTMSTLGEELEGAAPASRSSVAEQVDRLRADHDAAIQAVGASVASAVQELRVHVDQADDRIRADAQAADQAQAAAISRAAEDGKTWTEAALAGLAARAEAAAIDAQAARAAAAEAESKAKAHADARAGELAGGLKTARDDAAAARAESEGGLPWWGELALVLAGLVPASWGVSKIARRIVLAAIAAFDRQPFEGPNGEKVAEADLVARLPPAGKPAA